MTVEDALAVGCLVSMYLGVLIWVIVGTIRDMRKG
jgi:hypothetical protein